MSMFKINAEKNRIAPLEVKRFSELGFAERQHLQEWIANFPQVLGEELLIIQKEFAGFDDTRERLDLLALDRQGNLIIIENKLDDSGRDVVWQALKYAGYCANLRKSQVVEIFQSYIDRYEGSSDAAKKAEERISEFMKLDFDEVMLNSGQSQRIILVAADFRKEVTNTALWLIGHGIPCQCFKATPYVSGDQLLLNFVQVIPTPEANDYMIGLADKEAEEKNTSRTIKKSQDLRLNFWTHVLEGFRQSDCDLFDNMSPSRRGNWISKASGIISGMPYTLAITKTEVRVEFNMETSDPLLNSLVYEQLYASRESIESDFGDQLMWLPLPEETIACRLKYRKETETLNESNWPEITQWFVKYIVKLEAVLRQPLKEINQEGLGR